MTDFLELNQVVAAFIGALIALAAQALMRRGRNSQTAKRLSGALWEELSATNFYGPDDKPNFTGFSSQTFDTLFREVAEMLPEGLVRDLMRYHWRMKHMEEMKPVSMPAFGGVQPQFWAEAKELHGRLLKRLAHFGGRSWLSIFFRNSETCPKSLLIPPVERDAT